MVLGFFIASLQIIKLLYIPHLAGVTYRVTTLTLNEVTPNGGKWWRFKYQFDGKEKLILLGIYPEVPLAGKWYDPKTKKIWISGARDKRDKAKELIASDINPSDNRKAVKRTNEGNLVNSFEVIAREWIATKMQTKSEGYQKNVLRRFELYLFPWLGKRALSEINAPELLDVIRSIEKLNKIETAYRTLQATGQVFRYAVQTGRILRDITTSLRGALTPSVTKHMASFTEPQQVAELMRAIDGFTGTLTVQIALRLAPLVFVRPS